MTDVNDEFPISPSRAQEILSALANGEGPDSGALLPADHVVNRPHVAGALILALDALAEKSPTPMRGDVRHPVNAGKPWTEEENRDLISEYAAGRSIDELAARHGRTPVAIQSRLEQFALLNVSSTNAPQGSCQTKRQRGARTGKAWTQEDDEALVSAVSKGLVVATIAQRLERSPAAVEVRVAKLGLLPTSTSWSKDD